LAGNLFIIFELAFITKLTSLDTNKKITKGTTIFTKMQHSLYFLSYNTNFL